MGKTTEPTKNETDNIICSYFDCDDNLAQYTDSMLFDSEDTSVAAAEFMKDGKVLTIDLCVRGSVDVTFKGERYNRPSEFPEELKEHIRKHPNDWDIYAPSGDDDEESNIYVGMNNWFEFIWNYDDGGGDGLVCEDDISKMTKDQILEKLTEIAKWVFDDSRTEE
jgi:hypothetical protein